METGCNAYNEFQGKKEQKSATINLLKINRFYNTQKTWNVPLAQPTCCPKNQANIVKWGRGARMDVFESKKNKKKS